MQLRLPAGAAGRGGSARASRGASTAARASAKEVTLLDYGAGNIRSVRNAIKKLGYTIKDVRAAGGRRAASPAPLQLREPSSCAGLASSRNGWHSSFAGSTRHTAAPHTGAPAAGTCAGT